MPNVLWEKSFSSQYFSNNTQNNSAKCLPEAVVPPAAAALEQDAHAVEAALGRRVVQRVRRGKHGGRVGLVAADKKSSV